MRQASAVWLAFGPKSCLDATAAFSRLLQPLHRTDTTTLNHVSSESCSVDKRKAVLPQRRQTGSIWRIIRDQASNSAHGASGHRRVEPSATTSAGALSRRCQKPAVFSERAPARICRYINTAHRPLLFRISLQEPPAAPFSGVLLPEALSGQG